VSADGHVIAFESGATNLVSDDTNGKQDVFIRILSQQITMTRASTSSSGLEANGTR
jgi:hypothetical protein